jgi:hypothetical protein
MHIVKAEPMYAHKLHYRLVLNAAIGINGLSSYRPDGYILLQFFKLVNNTEEVNPNKLPFHL